MKIDEVDMGVSEQDAIMGAIWSKHCMTPYHDAILLGDDILLVDEDGDVSSGISYATIKRFGAEA